tara:strand:+ start:424 stop:660 length:237 start_codon:yes stop_codon:yes gene_type:complete
MAKIKEEQLKQIVDLQKELNQIVNQIGSLEANKHSLLHKLAGVNEDTEKLKVELEKEYGQVNIDLSTGEYTIIEKEEK